VDNNVSGQASKLQSAGSRLFTAEVNQLLLQ